MATLNEIAAKYGRTINDGSIVPKEVQKEHGDSKFVSAAKMRGWIR